MGSALFDGFVGLICLFVRGSLEFFTLVSLTFREGLRSLLGYADSSVPSRVTTAFSKASFGGGGGGCHIAHVSPLAFLMHPLPAGHCMFCILTLRYSFGAKSYLLYTKKFRVSFFGDRAQALLQAAHANLASVCVWGWGMVQR